MDFIHKHYTPGDTIAAIATAPGEGAISIIRVSGNDVFTTINKIFSKDLSHCITHTAHHGKILDSHHQIIDDVLVLLMLGKKSFVGEDTVEIHCHGGSLVTKKVFERVLEAGARPANPGEFTYRAFLSGKIDLTQAESIQELVFAKNDLALKHAEYHLEGRLKKKVESFQKDLVDITAIFEAWVDYPEEGLEFASYDEILLQLMKVRFDLNHLCQTFHEGKVISSKLSLCLLGAPNAGKSSLMNALCGKNRAIVTPIAGTTRDIIEEDVHFAGLNFKLMDTAGLRETDECIEKEGILRSKQSAASADLILYVVDSSLNLSAEELPFFLSLPKDKTILVWNKIDLAYPTSSSYPFQTVAVSAKHLNGLDELKKAIHHLFLKEGFPSKEELIITSQRHFHALQLALKSLDVVISGLQNNLSPEFLSFEMRQVLLELGTIIGCNITEDILSSIFSKFCVGK